MRKGEPFLLQGIYSMYTRAGQPPSPKTGGDGCPRRARRWLSRVSPFLLLLLLRPCTSGAAQTQFLLPLPANKQLTSTPQCQLTLGTTKGFTKTPQTAPLGSQGMKRTGVASVVGNRTSWYLLNSLSLALSCWTRSCVKISKTPVCAAAIERQTLLKRSFVFFRFQVSAGGDRSRRDSLPGAGTWASSKRGNGTGCSEPHLVKSTFTTVQVFC